MIHRETSSNHMKRAGEKVPILIPGTEVTYKEQSLK